MLKKSNKTIYYHYMVGRVLEFWKIRIMEIWSGVISNCQIVKKETKQNFTLYEIRYVSKNLPKSS